MTADLSELQQSFTTELFQQAPFIRDLGARVTGVGRGWLESELDVQPRLLQQNGFVHAGVQATLADHSAGAAAATLAPIGHNVLTVEFKVNLLRPALAQRLLCRADVLKSGRMLTVVESSVYADRGDGSDAKLVSKATVTIAIVKPKTK